MGAGIEDTLITGLLFLLFLSISKQFFISFWLIKGLQGVINKIFSKSNPNFLYLLKTNFKTSNMGVESSDIFFGLLKSDFSLRYLSQIFIISLESLETWILENKFVFFKVSKVYLIIGGIY